MSCLKILLLTNFSSHSYAKRKKTMCIFESNKNVNDYAIFHHDERYRKQNYFFDCNFNTRYNDYELSYI